MRASLSILIQQFCVSVTFRYWLNTSQFLHHTVIQEPTYANVLKQIYDIVLNTSRTLLLLIINFVFRKVTFKLWWEIWHKSCGKFTAESKSNSERIFKICQHCSKLRMNIEWRVFYGLRCIFAQRYSDCKLM